MAHIVFNSFANFGELTEALVTQWLHIIDDDATHAPAYFALAGGTTPAPIYRRFDHELAQRDVTHIKLVATDERWVEDHDPQSNEGVFKQALSKSYGQQWHLVSLKNSARTPEVAVESINERLHQQIPQTFDAILLGMGGDGHIASLFPGAPTQHNDSACIAAFHPETKQSRMSLTLPRLLDTKRIWLVITGAGKRAVFDSAEHSDLPISALLREATGEVEVFWCP